MNNKLKNEILETITKKALMEQKRKGTPSYVEMMSKLMHSNKQAQVFHRQTNSFAEHEALGGYYDAIEDLIDDLIETYQGKHGILKGYDNYDLVDYSSNSQVIKYFTELESDVDAIYPTIKDTYIQNQLDEVKQLINKTLYKLKFLK
jgi:hypothetical protein